MKVRVTMVEGGPGDGAAPFVRERVQPTLRSAEGCEGLIALKTDDGRGMSIALWRDDQAMQGSEDVAASLRAEAEEQGYRPEVMGRYTCDLVDVHGGDAQAARFVRWSGSGDVAQVVRDKVVPSYGQLDGFSGLCVFSDERGGIGVSLWASRTAIDNARDTTGQLGGWLEEAGFTLDSVETCDVTLCDVSQTAHA